MKRPDCRIQAGEHPQFPEYIVFSDGTVFSRSRMQTQKNGRTRFRKGGWMTIDSSQKYSRVSMRSRMRYLHRIIAETFVPKQKGKTEVNHKDGNKRNNDVSNLEWVTHQENMRHAYKMKLFAQGENHYKSKLSNTRIKEMVEMYNTGGLFQREVGTIFGMSQSRVSYYVKRAQ